MTKGGAPATSGPDAWGLVATVKAPKSKLLAFLAYHLDLGAGHVWLYFDDPDDPACAAVSDLAHVTAIACDAAHWARIGRRPDRHQNRQSRNAQDAYRACTLPWLAHLDVDEFLLADLPPGEILAGLPRHQAMLRAEPFEAMHDPTLPDDIYTARLFRGALRDPHAALRPAVLGPYAGVLPQAMLSHLAGKAFFRTGINGLSPRLHGAFLNGERLPGPPFDPRLRLLHFHAQDRAAWQAALPFRLTRGAYQYHPDLQSHLAAATPEQVTAFYATTQELTADSIAVLRKAGRLVEADLNLADKVAQLEKARHGHA